MAWASIPLCRFASGTFPNTNQTNFTALIKIVDTKLRLVANGGVVTSASGYDIQPFSDAAATPGNELKFHRLLWTESTGTLLLAVKIPTANTGAVTDVYVAIGNSAVTTEQQDKPNTWASAVKLAMTFGDGSAVDFTDDIGGTTLTQPASAMTVSTDKYGKGAIQGDGTANSYAERSSAPVTAIPITLFGIFKRTGDSGGETLVGINRSAAGLSFCLDLQPSFSGRYRVGTVDVAGGTWATNTWSSMGGASSSSTAHKFYVNGASVATSSTSASPGTPDNVTVGVRHFSSSRGQQLNGLVGLALALNTAQGDDWFAAMHNVWLDNATWLTVTGLNAPPPAPTWSGTTPADGTEVATGATISLDARSTDTEDGALTGNSIVFEYQLNGSASWVSLGSPSTGQTAINWSPADGHYLVRATVTDSGSSSANSTRTFHVNRYAVGGTWVARGLTLHTFSNTSHYAYAFVPYHWPKVGRASAPTIFWQSGSGESTGTVSGSGPYTLGEGNSQGLKQYETNVPRLCSIYATHATTPWQPFIIVTQTMLVSSIPVGHFYSGNQAARKRGQIDWHKNVRNWAAANWNIDLKRIVWAGHSGGATSGWIEVLHYANATDENSFQYAGLVGSEPSWAMDDIGGAAAGTSWTNNGVTLNYHLLDSTAYPNTAQGKLESRKEYVRVIPPTLKHLLFFGSNDAGVTPVDLLAAITGSPTYTSPPSGYTTPDYAGVSSPAYKGGIADVLKYERGAGSGSITHRGYTGTEDNVMNYAQAGQNYGTDVDVFDMSDLYYHNPQVALFSSPQINSGTSGVSIYQLDPRNALAHAWLNARELPHPIPEAIGIRSMAGLRALGGIAV